MSAIVTAEPQPERIDWLPRIERVLAGEGLRIHVQPIVDVATGRVAGYEALSRFDGVPGVGPDAWFAAAREFGLAAELEAAAITAALGRRDELPPNCFLSINVSPDLLLDPVVWSAWSQDRLEGVVIELTEQVAIEDYEPIGQPLERLRALGALVAVDDAGSGYAGLRHLLTLRPSIIKLDRELVQGLDRDPVKASLIEMLGGFADRIDAWLLAEGVERIGELDALAALGVPLAQGYGLGRPGPDWPKPPIEAAARMVERRASHRPAGPTVFDITHEVPTAREFDEARLAFAADPTLRLIALVDSGGRPLAALDPVGALDAVVSTSLRVHRDTPLRDALARALAREEDSRFSPVLVTDEVGMLVGVVRIEWLMAAALTT